MALDLGFAVNKAGPLTQVSVQIFNLSTAVQLATGIYGWWKTNERSQSLDQAFEAAGGHLVTSSAFNLQYYKDVRQYHYVQGAVVGEGTVRTVALPKASTAISDDPGRNCLRALTTALLCLYTTDATVMVLAEVIPSCLVHLDQEDASFEISGPLYASLKAVVQGVAKEEDNDTLRRYLLEQARDDEDQLFAGTGNSIHRKLAESLRGNDLEDIALIAGALRWALTSPFQRPFSNYATRSLTVWVLAGMVRRLGFEITASPTLCDSDATAEQQGGTPKEQNKGASVTLNVATNGQTDPWERGILRGASRDHCFIRPLLTDVASVPWLAYKHLGEAPGLSCAYLTKMFNYARLEVQNMTSSLKFDKGKVKLNLAMPANGYPDSCNQTHAGFEKFVDAWGPKPDAFDPAAHLSYSSELVKLAWTVADGFLRTVEQSAFRFSTHSEAALIQYKTAQDEPGGPLTPIQIFQTLFPQGAIQSLWLGSFYGIMSHFVLGQDHHAAGLSSVAFFPLLLDDHSEIDQYKSLFDDIDRFLKGTATYNDLLATLARLVLGWSPDLVDKLRREERLVLGLQSNGLSMLSQFAVNPTLDRHSLCRFYVINGLIIDLPVSEDNYVVMHHRVTPGKRMKRFGKNNCQQKLSPFESSATLRDDMYRFSLEPCWEHDYREVVYRLRHKGTEFMSVCSDQLKAWLLATCVSRTVHHVCCTCSSPTLEIEAEGDDEDWAHISIESFLTFEDRHFSNASGPPNLRHTRSWTRDFDFASKTLLDAGDCTPLQLAIIGMAKTSQLFLSDGCLRCTYEAYRERTGIKRPGTDKERSVSGSKPNILEGTIIMMV